MARNVLLEICVVITIGHIIKHPRANQWFTIRESYAVNKNAEQIQNKGNSATSKVTSDHPKLVSSLSPTLQHMYMESFKWPLENAGLAAWQSREIQPCPCH